MSAYNITAEWSPRGVIIREGISNGARKSTYYHPDVEIYILRAFAYSHVDRAQLNSMLCWWLQDHGFKVSLLRDYGGR